MGMHGHNSGSSPACCLPSVIFSAELKRRTLQCAFFCVFRSRGNSSLSTDSRQSLYCLEQGARGSGLRARGSGLTILTDTSIDLARTLRDVSLAWACNIKTLVQDAVPSPRHTIPHLPYLLLLGSRPCWHCQSPHHYPSRVPPSCGYRRSRPAHHNNDALG